MENKRRDIVDLSMFNYRVIKKDLFNKIKSANQKKERKSDEDLQFIKELNEYAYLALPDYFKSSFTSICHLVKKMNKKSINNILIEMMDVNEESKNYQIYKDSLSEEEILTAYNNALITYHGNPTLDKEKIPEWLINTSFINQKTNLLNIDNLVKGYIYEENNRLYIAFTGTEPAKRIEGVIADLVQTFDESYLYAMASGLLNMAMHKKEYDKIIVVGHSLGGGLTQFSVMSNNHKKISGICFNSAGLSKKTLNNLKGNDVISSINRLQHYTTENDLVSRLGAIIGNVQHLKSYGPSGHSLEDLKIDLNHYLSH